MTKTLPIPYLHECFDVNFDAGTLTWRRRPVSHFKDGKRHVAARKAAAWNGKHAKEAAGSQNGRGYLQVGIDGRMHRAHRIIWAMAHGAWPTGEIDHINGIRTDNRLLNLRVVSSIENSRNQTAKRGGTSRYPGVNWHKATGKWRAYITIDGKLKHLGYFENEIEAAEAYRTVARAAGFSERHLQPAGGSQ